MCIRFSPDNYYVMSMGGDDRSAMQWRVLPAAHDDVVVDKPAFSEYHVYQPPKNAAVVMDEPLVGPRVDAKASCWLFFGLEAKALQCVVCLTLLVQNSGMLIRRM